KLAVTTTDGLAETLEPLDPARKLVSDLARLVPVADHVGRDEHDQLRAAVDVAVDSEEVPEDGDIHQVRDATPLMGDVVVDDAADQYGLPVLNDHRRLGFARSERRRVRVAERGRTRSHVTDFLPDLHVHQS